MPFSIVHKAVDGGGPVKVESVANSKLVTIMSKNNTILRGDLNALLTSRMSAEISRIKFDQYAAEAKATMLDKLGEIPQFLIENEIPL